MKKFLYLGLVVTLIFSTVACRKMKEKKIARKIEGKWELTEVKTKVDGRDTTITDFTKAQIVYEFNACEKPDSLRPCNGSCSIVNSADTLYKNNFYPLSIWYIGTKKKDANKVRILINGVSKTYNIKEYKKDALELTELDSAGVESGYLKAKAVEEKK